MLRRTRHQAGFHFGRRLARSLVCAVLAAVVVAVAILGADVGEPRRTPSRETLWTLYPLGLTRAGERPKTARRQPFRAQKLWDLYPLDVTRAGQRSKGSPRAATRPLSPALRGEWGQTRLANEPRPARRERAEPTALERSPSLKPLLFVALGFGLVGVALALLAMRTGSSRRLAVPGLPGTAGRAATGGKAPRTAPAPEVAWVEAQRRTRVHKRATAANVAKAVAARVNAAEEILALLKTNVDECVARLRAAPNGARDGDGYDEAEDAGQRKWFVGVTNGRLLSRRRNRRSTGVIPHYLSADTAPVGFAVTRSVWAAPSFLVLLALACAAALPTLPALTSWYVDVVAALARVSERGLVRPDISLSFRPFFVILIVLLSAFAFGSVTQRLKLFCFSLSLYATSVLVLDLVLARATASFAPAPFSPVGGIAAGFAGLLAIVISVFARYRLPEGVKISRRLEGSQRVVLLLASCLALALALTTVFAYARRTYFDDLHVRLIGGLDSELVIFLLGLVCLLFFATALDRNVKPKNGPKLSVGFVIPAFNEAHGIAETIDAIDDAAARYGGRCRLYVVDNGSRDETREVAARAIAGCRTIEGVVLESPRPGKAHALNLGLSRVAEDIVVRIDADTLVSPSLLQTVVPWFWDPFVGGVSGLPLPKPTTPRWLYPLRIIEVYYGVAFLRVAQAAADGVMVMPGLIACYRGDVVRQLGGFAEGINGEDADISMRIGRLGYRVITDPTVHVQTEVPENLWHLREQRQRWARGLFHMASRNMSTIWMCQGARGLWILPWSILNAARRSMMIPVLACALTVEAFSPAVLSLREISVIGGFIVGLQLVVIAVVLLAHRQFRALPFVPAYLLFRMFRAYIAFETLLTLCLKGERSAYHIAGTRPDLRPRSSAIRRPHDVGRRCRAAMNPVLQALVGAVAIVLVSMILAIAINL